MYTPGQNVPSSLKILSALVTALNQKITLNMPNYSFIKTSFHELT